MISFIIPAYNAEKTIEKTINSILAQKDTSLDYEIVIVNDGSKDNLKEVINTLKNKLKEDEKNKINYFEKKNGGVADTRNFAVNEAKGNYIIFVDSDDYIADDLLHNIEKYVNENIELIKWSPIFVDKNGNEIQKNEAISFEKVSGEEGFNKLFGKEKLIDALWTYAIKKEILEEFPKGCYHEDFATLPIVILKAKTMVSLDKYEYYYVQTENSIMRNKDKERQHKKLEDMLNHYDNLIKKCEKMALSKKTKENLAIFATNSLLVRCKELAGKEKKYFDKELKKRRVSKNIKIRNLKQLIKRCYLSIKY